MHSMYYVSLIRYTRHKTKKRSVHSATFQSEFSQNESRTKRFGFMRRWFYANSSQNCHFMNLPPINNNKNCQMTITCLTLKCLLHSFKIIIMQWTGAWGSISIMTLCRYVTITFRQKSNIITFRQNVTINCHISLTGSSEM